MLKKLLTLLFKKDPSSDNIPRSFKPASDIAKPHPPVSFGYKCNWLAVSSTDTEKLAAAIGLQDAKPCNWNYGVDYGYDGRCFVTPPIEGWSFVVSRQLPYAEDKRSIKTLKTLLTDLSKEFGQAQYFGTLRTAGYDSWIKAENGEILRAYALADGTNTIIEGEPTGIEKKYNLVNTLSEEFQNDPDYFDRQDVDWPDESMTMEIAGAWSFNPQDLEERTDLPSALGLQGFCQF